MKKFAICFTIQTNENAYRERGILTLDDSTATKDDAGVTIMNALRDSRFIMMNKDPIWCDGNDGVLIIKTENILSVSIEEVQ